MSPRNVRPSWIEVSVDDRGSDVATGPRSRTGQLSATLSVRDDGSVLRLLDVEVIPDSDGKTSIVRVTDKRGGRTVFEERLRYGSTDEDERRGTRMELGKAKELVEALGKVDGFRAAYFVASEFTK